MAKKKHPELRLPTGKDGAFCLMDGMADWSRRLVHFLERRPVDKPVTAKELQTDLIPQCRTLSVSQVEMALLVGLLRGHLVVGDDGQVYYVRALGKKGCDWNALQTATAKAAETHADALVERHRDDPQLAKCLEQQLANWIATIPRSIDYRLFLFFRKSYNKSLKQAFKIFRDRIATVEVDEIMEALGVSAPIAGLIRNAFKLRYTSEPDTNHDEDNQ